MRFRLSVTLIFILSINLFSMYDYTMDVVPAIRTKKMFSVGMAMKFSEYNGYFYNNTLYYRNTNDMNVSFINQKLLLIPHIEYRPFKFMEIGAGLPFAYIKNEEYSVLLNETKTETAWVLEGVHSHVKFAIIDWFLSLGVRVDFDYYLRSKFNKNTEFNDNADISTTVMLAIVPKKIPVNVFFNYRHHFTMDLHRNGTIIGGVEIITSKILSLHLGTTYMFSYYKKGASYVEPFVKFAINIGEYVTANVSYSKYVWGMNNPNAATFLLNIDFNF